MDTKVRRQGRHWRRLARGLLTAPLLLVLAAHAEVRPSHLAEENLLKAVFVYNFAKFTRWPDTAWEAPRADLLLCTAGDDAVVEALQQLAGRRVKGHPVVLRALDAGSEAGQCHALYIATSESDGYAAIVSSVLGKPVLTITQLPRSGRMAAMIQLFEQEGRIRFIIDVAAARKGGLEFSSRLLNLGIVEGFQS